MDNNSLRKLLNQNPDNPSPKIRQKLGNIYEACAGLISACPNQRLQQQISEGAKAAQMSEYYAHLMQFAGKKLVRGFQKKKEASCKS